MSTVHAFLWGGKAHRRVETISDDQDTLTVGAETYRRHTHDVVYGAEVGPEVLFVAECVDARPTPGLVEVTDGWGVDRHDRVAVD